MSDITDRINAIETVMGTDGVPLVSLEAVLAAVKNAVLVEIDPEMYPEIPEGQTDRETLAVVSTAYNLLADTAALFASRAIRADLEAAGVSLTSDEVAFATSDSIHSYRDLAARNPDRVEELGDVFELLVSESTRNARLGAILSLRDLG